MKFGKGLIFSIIGCLVSAFGMFLQMKSDCDDIKNEFRETYNDKVRDIVREELGGRR